MADLLGGEINKNKTVNEIKTEVNKNKSDQKQAVHKVENVPLQEKKASGEKNKTEEKKPDKKKVDEKEAQENVKKQMPPIADENIEAPNRIIEEEPKEEEINRIIEDEPKEEVVYRGGKVEKLTPAEIAAGRKIYNHKDKEVHMASLCRLLGIDKKDAPKDRNELVLKRNEFMHLAIMIDEEEDKQKEDYDWNTGVDFELRKEFDWLMEYYKINDASIEAFMNDQQIELPVNKGLNASIGGLEQIYEKQGTNNCFCCAGTTMLNQFLRNKKGEKTAKRRYSQYDMRNYSPRVKKYSKDFDFFADEEEYKERVTELSFFAGKGKTAVGNVFELGDFFYDELSKNNAMLNKMIFIMPGLAGKDKKNDNIMANNAKEAFKSKIAEVIGNGNVVGFLDSSTDSGHYVTITGIHGDEIEYLDSNIKDYNKTQRRSVDQFLYRNDSHASKQFEIEWISEMKKPQEMKQEYSDLEYDEKTGYSVKRLSDENVLNVAHTKGLTVRKALGDLAPGVSSEVAYIPNPKMSVETTPMQDYVIPQEELIRRAKEKAAQKAAQKAKNKAADKAAKTETKQETRKETKLKETAENSKEKTKEEPREKESKEQKSIKKTSKTKERNLVKKPVKELELLPDADRYKLDVYKRIDNKQFDRTMETIMGKAVRTGFTIKHNLIGSAREIYNLDNTLTDVNTIKALINSLEDNSYVRADRELAIARLSAVQGRNLSHLMLNDKKLFGDSSEMKKVKGAVGKLEKLLTEEKKHALTDKEMDKIAELYRTAMDECQKYCDAKNSTRKTGMRRKAMVQATLNRLTREAELFELGRQALKADGDEAGEVKSGMALLSYGALSDYTFRLKNTNSLREAETERDDLKKEVELKQAAYDTVEKEYNELYKQKEEEYGFLAKIRIPFDDEINELKERLNACSSDLEEINKKLENMPDVKEELINKQEEREKRRKANAEEIKSKEVGEIHKNVVKLPADLQLLTYALDMGEGPTYLFMDKKKPTSAEKKTMRDLLKARRALLSLEPGSPKAATVRLNGHFVRFISDKFGNLVMQAEGQSVHLSIRGDQIADNISKDVFDNQGLYGEEDIKDIIEDQKTDLSAMNRGELLRTREYCARVLNQKTGIAMNLLNNVPVSELKNAALIALDKNTDKKQLIKTFRAYVDRQNSRHRDVHINTVLNQELQNVGMEFSDSVKLLYENKEEDSGWNEEEELVRDLAADLLFSEDTWVSDGMKKEPALRMRSLLMRHSRAIALIISDGFRDKSKNPDGLILGMIEKLPMFALDDGGNKELKEKVESALEQVTVYVEKMINAQVADMGLGFVQEKMAKAVAKGKLMDPKEVQKLIEEKLPGLDNEELQELAKVDKYIDDAVKEAMNGVQQSFDKSVDIFFGGADEEEKEKEEKKKKAQEEDPDLEVIEASPLITANKKYSENEEKVKLAKQRFDNETAQLKELQFQIQNESLRLAGLYLQGESEDARKSKKKRSKDDIIGADNHAAIEETKKLIDKLTTEREKLVRVNNATKEELKKNEADLLIAKRVVEAESKKERMNNIKIRIVNREAEKPGLLMEIDEINAQINEKQQAKEALAEEKSKLAAEEEKLDTRYKMLGQQLGEIDKEYKIELWGPEGVGKMFSTEKKNPSDNPKRVPVEKEFNELWTQIEAIQKQVKGKDKSIRALDKEVKKLTGSIKDIQKKITDLPEKSAKELEDILNDTAKGKKGQGLFMKNVFKTYFKNVPVMDQRSMLAGAIKNSKPAPKMTKQEKDNLSSEDQVNLMAGMLGGMFKGAGPLFQKMLQGVPMGKDFPEGLKKAIMDTQDSLASIPDEVVHAHMDSIIERSNGRIEKIEVVKSLGAASVGQAFLCKVYGKEELKDGKNVVVKLLRPDARNRMMREKQVMLNAARMTDEAEMLPAEIEAMRKKNQIGGMEATYLGNLQRIEEELDLTKEADNCRQGAIYNKPVKDSETKKEKPNMCDAMKISDLAAPTSDTCVMEMAGSMTVKRYLSDVKEKGDRLIMPFVQTEDEIRDGKKTGRKIPKTDKEGKLLIRKDLTLDEQLEVAQIKQELIKTVNELDKKQKALVQLAEKWVTEGIFEAGYYHGDLHAGNIMISDMGVTVIDFGNATKLNEDQQTQITKLMMAATFSDVDAFRHAFHNLLENTPEEVYDAKKDELTLIFKEILNMGSEKDAALRISVALAKAQEIGLELPPTIANFVSCQMRLQNTIKEANDTLKGLQNNIAQLDKDVIVDYGEERRDIDVIAGLLYKTQKLTKADTLKEECKKELTQRELMRKEDFLGILRNNPKEMETFGIHDSSLYLKEVSRMNELVKGARPTKKEKDIMERQGFEELFPNFEFYTKDGSKGGKYKRFISNLSTQMEVLIKGRRTEEEEAELKKGKNYKKENIVVYEDLEDFAHRAGTEDLPDLRELWKDCTVSAKQSVLSDLMGQITIEREKGDKADQKKIEELENRLYDAYVAENSEQMELNRRDSYVPYLNLIPKAHNAKKGTEEYNDQNELMKDGIKLFRDIVETAYNKTNGKELIAEFKKLEKLANEFIEGSEKTREKAENIRQALIKFSPILWDAQNYKLHELHDNAKDKEEDQSSSDPDDFLQVMGEVLEKYKGRLAWRLGIKQGLKVKRAMKKIEKEEEKKEEEEKKKELEEKAKEKEKEEDEDEDEDEDENTDEEQEQEKE